MQRDPYSHSNSAPPYARRIPPQDIDDALQFTPLSSVVPFAPESIPLPFISSPGGSHTFPDDLERQQSRQTLDQLNDTAEQDPDSKLVRKYLKGIASCLSSDELTEYRFKPITNFGKPPVDKHNVGAADSPLDFFKNPKIGKFGDLVLKKTDVPFRFASSESPVVQKSASVKPEVDSGLKSEPVEPATPQPRPHGGEVTLTSNGVRMTPAVVIEKRGVTPSSTQKAAAVIVSTPAQFDPSQYSKHVELDARMRKLQPIGTTLSSKSRKRKRSHSDEDEDQLAGGVDQRAKAESHVRALESLLGGIFQAEDNLQPDTSDRAIDKANKYWLISSLDGDSPCLSSSVQVKLEHAIYKVIDAGRFSTISVDDLTRVQKLCESTLKLAEATSVKLSHEIGEEAGLYPWLERVNIVDNGLKTAKSVLRIMVGGREEKQVYNEDILQSVLAMLKSLLDESICPAIEMKATGDKAEAFKIALTQKKVLGGLLHELTNVLSLLSLLITSEDVPETAVTTLEFLAKDIIFLENASSEKDSLFGVQKVERFRVASMDILAKIFARYEDQRTFIFDEILTSLEKLPVNRQSARQFKLVEGGKNIQLVSALIMTLIQTSATYHAPKKGRSLTDADGNGEPQYGEDSQGHEISTDQNLNPRSNPTMCIDRLDRLCSGLYRGATKDALYLVQFLVQRAMKSTKTGDAPYRQLMDIFTEDFLAVLQSPEWPGADLLLQQVLLSMVNIVDSDKHPAPAKAMALDLLGLMGSSICDIFVHMKGLYSNKESMLQIDFFLGSIVEQYFSPSSKDNSCEEDDVIDWEGPYRWTSEYLLEQTRQDKTLQSSYGYHLVSWGNKICTIFNRLSEEDMESEVGMKLAQTAYNLSKMMTDPSWEDEFDFDLESISTSRIRQAYTITVMYNTFCRSFEHIITRLLRAIDNDQATIRSKGLKSIMQLFQKDPAILDRPKFLEFIKSKAIDPSPLVRDSVVDLLGKFITLRPDLEPELFERIKGAIADAAVGVRKRAMKLCKDIYLRTVDQDIRISISRALMGRIKDPDSAVAELARKTFEDIWIAPLYPYVESSDSAEIPPKAKQMVNERLQIMVRVIHSGGDTRSSDNIALSVLHNLIQSLLGKDAKNVVTNFKVCKAMVGSMFDDLLDRQSETDKAERQNILQALTVFARANAKLFAPEQLEMLEPYVENLTVADDLHVFRSVIIIYRCALPALSSVQSAFLIKVQQALLKSLSRLGQKELAEVIPCLWTINGVLKNIDRLVRVAVSCIKLIHGFKPGMNLDDKQASRLIRSINILGLIGKECDFEEVREKFPPLLSDINWKPGPVYGLVADTILPFTSTATPTNVRMRALESLGDVCQSHPPLFLETRVLQAFDSVFTEANADLQNLVLLGFKAFLQIEERRSEITNEQENDQKEREAIGRLEIAVNSSQNDGVSTSIAQKYLKEITKIALGSIDHYALTGVEIIASISRQGLVHPKECIPTLMALQTSTEPSISSLSFRELHTLHNKHETIAERCYVDGLRQCFNYNYAVLGNTSGATAQPFASRLRPMYDIVKTSRKARKKFLSVLTSSLDFDPAKLDLEVKPNHFEFSRFVVENLAFFDYSTVEELQQVLNAIERLVAGIGVTVAHSIETEVFLIGNETVGMTANPKRLRHLSITSAILSFLWETRQYLRKLYGLGGTGKTKNAKPNNKENYNKAPTKAPFVSGAPLWEQYTQILEKLGSDEGLMEQCRDFVEILNIDKDLKVAGDEDEELEVGDHGGTPSDVSGDEVSREAGTPSKMGRKRKVPSTPTKARKKSKPKPKKVKDV